MARFGGPTLRVTPPDWRGRASMPEISLLDTLGNIDTVSEQNPRPLFIYVTSSDPEEERKVSAFESALFSNEKLLIALKLFDTYKIDLENLEEGDKLLLSLNIPKPLTFHCFHRSNPVFHSKPEPSSSELLNLCGRAFSKVYKGSLDAYLREELNILDEIAKIDREVEQILDKRDRDPEKVTKTESEKLNRRLETLETRYTELKEKERTLLESMVLK